LTFVITDDSFPRHGHQAEDRDLGDEGAEADRYLADDRDKAGVPEDQGAILPALGLCLPEASRYLRTTTMMKIVMAVVRYCKVSLPSLSLSPASPLARPSHPRARSG
jgi:hypothetical protein